MRCLLALNILAKVENAVIVKYPTAIFTIFPLILLCIITIQRHSEKTVGLNMPAMQLFCKDRACDAK
jgi:hypothetical protein